MSNKSKASPAILKMGDNMQKILLGGRAFISRSQDIGNAVRDASGNVIGKLNTDIPLGESISVKSDQYYYLVKTYQDTLHYL